MGRALPIAAAVLIVIAAGVWLMWPADSKVRPAPGSPSTIAADPAKPPALATAGARSAAADANPAGARRPERAVAPGEARGERDGREVDGMDAPGAATKERPASAGGADGDAAAGVASAEKKKELWQGNLALRGRILDREGKPIAGAKVRLRDAEPWPGAPPRPIVETDAEGRFAFAELPSNRYQVFADAGSGEQHVAWYLLPGQEPIDLTFTPGIPKEIPLGVVVVRVVGPDGNPVPRAHVKVKGGKVAFGGFREVVHGTFLRGPPDDDATSYEVYGAQTFDYTPLPIGPATWTPKAGEPNVVTLPQGKTISGTVIGPDEKGVFGAEVVAYPVPATGERTFGPPSAAGKAVSDASGAFHLVNLGEGPHRLQATPQPPSLPSEFVDSPVAGETVTIRVLMGLEADVKVLDGEGKPVSGAVVSARSAAPTPIRSSRLGRGSSRQVTDTTGRAHLSQLVPGVAYGLTVSSPSSRKDLSDFTQESWEPKDTTITLSRAWSLKGTVRRADGAARLSFVHLRGKDGTWDVATPTKKDGSFEIKFAEPGPWVLAASASYDTPRGVELTITDPALSVELNAPAAPAPAPTK